MFKILELYTKDQLKTYVNDYLNKHVYLRSRIIARDFLENELCIQYKKLDYKKQLNSMSNNVATILQYLQKEGLIEKYNNSYLWKRV